MENLIYNDEKINITYSEESKKQGLYKKIVIKIKTSYKNSFNMEMQFDYGKNSCDIDINYDYNGKKVKEDVSISKFVWDDDISYIFSNGILETDDYIEPDIDSIYGVIRSNFYYSISHNATDEQEVKELEKSLENAMKIIKKKIIEKTNLASLILDFISYDFPAENYTNLTKTKTLTQQQNS